jgi:Ser/Thr protein kinase RdoA (MazF antagonist)
VKLYRWLSGDAVTGIIEAEKRAGGAGLPVPAVLYRSAHWPLVVYAYVHGKHQIPGDPALINICAELFVRQLGALRGFRPTWTPIRPDGLPRRAQEAINNCSDNQLREAIRESWQQLSRLAYDQPEAASHVDWRADNILCLDGHVVAVLDWECVVLLPSAEAVGYGAGSLTHSWREALYRPLALPPVMWFLEAAGNRLTWEPSSPGAAHARLAAFFTCAVRLAEDQQRGAATISYDDLRASLDG